MFLRHAREEVGLLPEKSPGQIGFFHLTLEEYLAAVDIARRGMEERRKRIKEHWSNPYWREVILLTAGELTLRSDDLVDFIVARILDQLGIAHQLMARWGAGH